MSALERAVSEPLLRIANLTKRFGGDRLFRHSPVVHAVEDVSLDVARGEVVGLVGESGSGKTTIARCALRLIEPTSGEVRFAGTDLRGLTQRELKPFRQRMQYVFQDPFNSLSPRMTVAEILAEGLTIQGIGTRAERRQRTVEVLAEVEMPEDSLARYPHQFSGGQRQRLGIARALALRPDFLVADEPVSALDVSIQAQIINLLRNLQTRRGLTMVFISHDLAVVEYLSDRVVVLYLGRVMEVAPTAELFATPHHPYTRALMAAVPIPDPGAPPRAALLHGDIASPTSPPAGCVLHTRCPFATAECARSVPKLREIAPGRLTACWRDDLPAAG
jgi:peptide/nickel transport system ATP-binding protein